MGINHEIPTRLSTKELLDPRRTPEAGFQSYEWFTNDAVAQKQAFLRGEARNPTFTYPMFRRISQLDAGMDHLAEVKESIRDQESDEVYGALAPSLSFRQAEMSYVKLLAQLDYTVEHEAPSAEVVPLATHVRQVGEILYGVPHQQIADAAYNELWNIIDGKELHPSAQLLRDELENGFVYQGIPCSPLGRAGDSEARLPRYENNPALEWFGEIVLEKNADIRALVDAFWEQKIAEHGPEYVCVPEDIVEAFEVVIELRDPSHESGVGVKLIAGKTALSWESPELSVHVGGKRQPIKSADELFAKILHEFGKHGQSCIDGLASDTPVLGTGLYTETARPDYLPFEEGVATTAEEIVGDEMPQWEVSMLGHYINVAEAAHNGHDFREVFEKSWRYRLLAQVTPGQEVTPAMIDKHKSVAYTACVRIFRGTPLNIHDQYPGTIPLTFNKDLAYLNGRVLALSYIEECYQRGDKAAIELLFRGKFDPTIPEQREIAEKALRHRAGD